MKLIPKRLPGPNARKARAFAADIRQLRAQGYTFEAIREALAGAGIHVSNSTVQREVARASTETLSVGIEVAAVSNSDPVSHLRTSTPIEKPPELQSAATPNARVKGEDVAESFMNGRVTNQLLRQKLRR